MMMMMMMNDVKLIAVKSHTSLGWNCFFFCVRNYFLLLSAFALRSVADGFLFIKFRAIKMVMHNAQTTDSQSLGTSGQSSDS